MAETRKPKLGAGHAMAWLRSGLKEAAQVLPAFPGHTVQPVEEQGLVGNPTSVEVYRDKAVDPVQLASARAREAGRETAMSQEQSF